ncbi:MAG: argininosuccinate lyase [Acidobacteria bacterium]|nr:argininosuccinate lyase [Acidobacteriota bacterium]
MTESHKDRMYAGRFAGGPDAAFDRFQRSFGFDRRLLPYELAVDRAWARAICATKIISREELQQILDALNAIEKRSIAEPAWLEKHSAEDVHHFVEVELIALIGATGAKLHTGRSRNELIAADFRMFVKDAAAEMRRAVAALVDALLTQAEKHFGVVMPGNTHMQRAQPILYSHYLHAQAEAFLRDEVRLAAASADADACPLGSGALAGCSFNINREAIAHELGFARITANSLDAVSDRDFALDYLFALVGLATHLSRLAEDSVLFASQEFGWLKLADAFSTGSSLMPQKKNPDAWELIRGKSGRVTAALVSLLTTMKGLPTGYQRDLQEDKEGVFAAHDQALAMVHVAAGAVAASDIHAEKMRAAAADPGLYATEAADFLVERGVPFRQAHEIVANVFRDAEQRGVSWMSLPVAELKKYSPVFDESLSKALTVESALARKHVPGGTAPDMVKTALANCRSRLQHAEAAR